METIHRDYSPQGVKFYYLYKKLQHPGINDYIDPLTIEERLLHLKVAKEKLGTQFTWICDTMDNEVRDALGRLPNSEIVVDPEGKIVRARAWSNAGELRADLEALVGKVDKITKVSDLGIERQQLGFDLEVAQGVVKPLEVDGRLLNIKTAAQPSADPYFVKLHAQADAELLASGTGKLYFAFHLDPIYEAHWNNGAAPVHFEFSAGEGASVSPSIGDSPHVEAEADLDPREFLVDVKDATHDTELTLTVKYFACTDEWCKPLTQSYSIYLQRDRNNQLSRPGARRRRPRARR